MGDRLLLTPEMKDARWSDGSGIAWWIDKPCPDDPWCTLMVMVGDDRRHHRDLEAFTQISDDDYCGGCGQIGCGHGG